MFDEIQAARERLRGHAHVTPIAASRALNELVGAEVFLKCENFQRAGAFKFRGAFNALSRLSEEEKARGIIAFSSGNHAQGVALAGKLFGVRVTVVMPRDAPAIKRAATEAYGATIIDYDASETSREELARSLQARHGYTLVPPFDHPDIIAGQGTVALEMLEELKTLDLLLIPCGGGGLLSGSAIAAKGVAPNCRVIGIEPELGDDATRSFRTKTLQVIKTPATIADGTRTPSLGTHTFPLVLKYVDDMQTVSEAAIIEAVQFLFYRVKLVVEPSGALGVAALLSRVVRSKGRVGVILSGGNVDAATMTKILAHQTKL